MLTREENERLTQVGPGTPMGDLFRCYWHPVGCSELVTSKPQRVTVLGEELVLYRGASGKAVLMQLRCAHRNVALDFGRVEGDSIRCPYHGWLYDQGGQCTAMPAEPEGDKSHEKVRLASYPTEEVCGMIFAYMGAAPAPVLPLYDVLRMRGGTTTIRAEKIKTNWLQATENILDVAHFSWLHGYTFPFFGAKRLAYKFERAEYGMDMMIGFEGAPLNDASPYVFPAINRFSLPTQPGSAPMQVIQFRVPCDDVSHIAYLVGFCANNDQPDGGHVISAVSLESETGLYRPLDGDWWGIELGDQDRMATEQQGVITDRTQEHLVTTDVGIVRMRRMFRDAMEAVAKGEDPIGIIRDPSKRDVDFQLNRGTSIIDVAEVENQSDYFSVVFG